MSSLIQGTPFSSEPDARGHFGPFGGRFVPETLVPALDELSRRYDEARNDPDFLAEFDSIFRTMSGAQHRLHLRKI